MEIKDKLVNMQVLKQVKDNLDKKDSKINDKLDAIYEMAQNNMMQKRKIDQSTNPVNVPSDSKLANIREINGKSVVWNQYAHELTDEWWRAQNGTTFTMSNGVATVTNTIESNGIITRYKAPRETHVYLIGVSVSTTENVEIAFGWGSNASMIVRNSVNSNGSWVNISAVVKPVSAIASGSNMYLWAFRGLHTFNAKNPYMFDLTAMFGETIANSLTVNSPEIAFIEQYASERPQYNPGEIINYGTKDIKPTGKNLAKPCALNGIGVDGTGMNRRVVSADLAWTSIIEVEPNTKYCLSISNYSQMISGYIRYAYFNTYPSIGAISTYFNAENASLVITTQSDTRYIIIFDSRTCPADCFLAKSDNIIPYVSYKESIIPVNPAILALDGYGMGINDTVRNYIEWTDDGKVYYHKMVGSVDLTNITWSRDDYEVSSYVFQVRTQDGFVRQNVAKYGGALLCRKYKYDGEKTYNSVANATIVWSNSAALPFLRIRDDSFTDLATFTASMNGVVCLYELATPEITDITNLMSWDGTVSTETGGTITFKADGDALLPIHTTIEYIIQQDKKQDKLIAGSNIIIAQDGKTISADLSSVDHLVKVSDTQPTSTHNKIWVKQTVNQIKIPTQDDLNYVANTKVDKFSLPNNGKMNLDDCDEGVLTQLVMEGHTSQNKYQGYNLCPVNSNQGYNPNFSLNTPIVSGKTYRITMNVQMRDSSHPNTWGANVRLNTIDGTGLVSLSQYSYGKRGATFTAKASGTAYLNSYWPAEITEIQIVQGSEDKSYEPYVGLAPSPNPSYPQPIHSVERIDVWTHGTNMFDSTSPLKRYDLGNGNIRYGRTFNGYPIIYILNNTTIDMYYRIASTDASDIQSVGASVWIPVGDKKTVRIPDGKAIHVFTTEENPILYKGIMVSSEDITSFEPYQGYTASIIPPRPLNAIGDYVDICDVESGVWKYRTNQSVRNLDINNLGGVSAGGLGWIDTGIAFPLRNYETNVNIYCSLAPQVYPNTLTTMSNAGWGRTSSNIAPAYNSIRVYAPTAVYNDVTIAYGIDTEQNISISASDLALLKSISTYKPNTVVSITDQDGNDISSRFNYPISLPDVIQQDKDDIDKLKAQSQKNKVLVDTLMKVTNGVNWYWQTDNQQKSMKSVPNNAHMADVLSIGGKSVVWNQHCPDDERTINISNDMSWDTYYEPNYHFVKGHKYIFVLIGQYKATVLKYRLRNYDAGYVGGAFVENIYVVADDNFNEGLTVQIYSEGLTKYNRSLCVVDVTQMFGIGNQPTTDDSRIRAIQQYAQLHPEYNEGEIVNFGTKEIKVVGKNLVDIDSIMLGKSWGLQDMPNRGYVDIHGDMSKQYHLSATSNCQVNIFYMSDQTTASGANLTYLVPVVLTPNTHDGCKFMRLLFVNTDNSVMTKQMAQSCHVMISEGASASNYTPYSSTITTINHAVLSLDGYGLSAGDVSNTIQQDDNGRWWYHKKVGSVDLGTLNWSALSAGSGAKRWDSNGSTFPSNIKAGSAQNTLCGKYVPGSLGTDKTVWIPTANWGNIRIIISDDSYADATALKTAMNGVMLNYELATPEVTDITDLMRHYAPLSVQAGGTIQFITDNAQMPIPNTIQYAVKNV